MVNPPYLLFLGDAKDQLAAKTAWGLAEWCRKKCIGQLRLQPCYADCGLPDLTIAEAVRNGAKTFVIGASNRGGILPQRWITIIHEAIEAGMDVANGLHDRLADVDELVAAARRKDVRLLDVRHSTTSFPVASGQKRTGKRLLTVGTDCSCGKKYTALAIARDMAKRGIASDFRATGQTGILISGQGVSLDTVPADFTAGAAEWLSPDNDPSHWDIIEGQGSLYHPSYAGISLALLHGSQPDAIVVCHEPTRKTMRGVDFPVPQIGEVMEVTLALGSLTNPGIRCVGVTINTKPLDSLLSTEITEAYKKGLGVPVVHPTRDGTASIINFMMEEGLLYQTSATQAMQKGKVVEDGRLPLRVKTRQTGASPGRSAPGGEADEIGGEADIAA